jgi:predicted phage-related endonuclease
MMVAVNVLRRGDAAKCRKRFGAVPTSDALQLLPFNATGQAWRDARRNRIGASELPTILGVPGAYGSPFALWWAKREGWETESTEEMSMGLRLEPIIGDRWKDENPGALLFRPGAALFGHPSLSWLCCTPDFLAVSEGWEPYCGAVPCTCGSCLRARPVECKAYEGGQWGMPGTDEVPPHIRLQVRVQCAVLGADMGYVVRMSGKRVRTFIVPAEPLTADEISRGHLFHLSIARDDPPGLDDTAATETALGRLYADLDPEGVAEVPLSAAIEYRLALAACRAAESRKQRAVNTLRALMGTAKTATADGVDVAERRVGKRAGYQVAPKVIDGLWPKKAGLEKLDG